MFVSARVSEALRARRDEFRTAAARSRETQERYLDALDALERLSLDDLAARLSSETWPSARATHELIERGLVIPFGERWQTAQEARSWALERLRGITTVAVDGSQIAASKEFAVPVALVQVAWFENPHDAKGTYVKDTRNEIMMAGEDERDVEQYAFTESRLNQRRFALEMQTAADYARSLATSPAPLIFVDGSLVLSFIGRMAPPAQSAYLHALFDVLAASQDSRVPVVGYVDLSYSRDLVGMLRTAFDLEDGAVFDAQILATRLGTFDRTAAFVTARGDVLPHYRAGDRDWSDQICFTYIKTGAERMPARIDFPRWILDAGLLDHVLDIIRCEVVVGSGYPYALETADAAAVLTTEERLQFYRLFHQFADDAGLDVLLPGKSVSKLHRR